MWQHSLGSGPKSSPIRLCGDGLCSFSEGMKKSCKHTQRCKAKRRQTGRDVNAAQRDGSGEGGGPLTICLPCCDSQRSPARLFKREQPCTVLTAVTQGQLFICVLCAVSRESLQGQPGCTRHGRQAPSVPAAVQRVDTCLLLDFKLLQFQL